MKCHLRPIRFLVSSLIFCGTLASAGDRPGNWLQVTSQYFSVYCDGSERDARHVADQFERMQLVFHTAFPQLQVDPAVPIVVIAVKDSKDFRALEPESYLGKGQLNLAGLFLRAPDKNYVLLRMDAGGDHPYAVVYHEYTHLLVSKSEEWLPLWLNEGLAEFYQNTDIREKDTTLGEASPENILLLRQHRLLPLAVLFTVDRSSPYYHEEQKGNIFYAEAWALTHYLQIKDLQNSTHEIADYAALVANHVDPVAAGTQAFGDLNKLQTALQHYVEQSSFKDFKLNKALDLTQTNLKVQSITASKADAVRADFLAYNQREKDARTLLDQVLKNDPNDTLAHETMGYLEFRAGHMDQAENWYQQAVKLDSQSFLANYYFASIAMNREQPAADIDAQIESSLQRAIKLNPSFAPSYDRLAVFYALSRHKNLDQAHLLSLQAVQLDPRNVRYRVNTAYILENMQRETDAITVLQTSMKLAKNAGEVAEVQSALDFIQREQSIRQTQQEQARRLHEETEASAQTGQPEKIEAPILQRQETVLKGPRRSVTGTIKNVRCSDPSTMDFDVETPAKKLALHSANYWNIQYSVLGIAPPDDLKPCKDLEGVHARLQYIESTEAKINGVVAIELHK